MATLELDAELMLRFKAGETVCLDQLLARYRVPVIQFLYRMVQNRAIAEELAQEVFLRVYRSSSKYEPSAKFTTWLFRIALHLGLNWLRDRGRERVREEPLDSKAEDRPGRQIADGKPNVDWMLVERVNREEIRRAIAALPERQRAAVLLHKYEEMDYAQIARTLECSQQAVKSMLFRAYSTLRLSLAHLAAR